MHHILEEVVLCFFRTGGADEFIFFFFSSRRRHTRWTGDWSSDVCSSDLGPLSQGGQRLGDIAAHRGGEQPDQGRESALRPNLLDHPDTSPGAWFDQVVKDHLAQRHGAFGHPAPPGFHLSDGEGAAKVAALLGPAGHTRLKRAIQPRDLLADIPLRPAVHVGPHRPDRSWLGVERCLAFEEVHALPFGETRPISTKLADLCPENTRSRTDPGRTATAGHRPCVRRAAHAAASGRPTVIKAYGTVRGSAVKHVEAARRRPCGCRELGCGGDLWFAVGRARLTPGRQDRAWWLFDCCI